jgi:DNA polymerase-3 subunit delta'
MSLKEIFCQDNAIKLLTNAFGNQRLAHAYIFAGIEGVGKFKTACEFAKLLLCREAVVKNNLPDSCCKCQSCTDFEDGTHPDFLHIYKELLEFTEDGKDKKNPIDLSIDVIRDFVIKKVSIKPSLSARKVFVISEGERLNRESQNALLKVLEEPPAYCTIILLCTRLENLLPTIKSRCQTIRFGPVSEEKIIEKLVCDGLDKQHSIFLARFCQGSIGNAVKLAELEKADAKILEIKKELIEALSNLQYQQAITLSELFLKKAKEIAAVWSEVDEKTSKSDINRRAARIIIHIVISALTDAMKLNVKAGSAMINFDQDRLIKKIAQFFSPQQAGEKITESYRSIQQLDANVNEKLIFDRLLLKLAESDKIKSLYNND